MSERIWTDALAIALGVMLGFVIARALRRARQWRLLEWFRHHRALWRLGRTVWSCIHASATGCIVLELRYPGVMTPTELDAILSGRGVVAEPETPNA